MGLIGAVGLDRGCGPRAGAGPGLLGAGGYTLAPDYPPMGSGKCVRATLFGHWFYILGIRMAQPPIYNGPGLNRNLIGAPYGVGGGAGSGEKIKGHQFNYYSLRAT